MKILEVGCAGGLLCHRIKEYLPNASITGIVEKAHFMAPDALTQSEYQTLLDMINRRYDAQIERYKSGEKNWEYRIVTTVLISGTK